MTNRVKTAIKVILGILGVAFFVLYVAIDERWAHFMMPLSFICFYLLFFNAPRQDKN